MSGEPMTPAEIEAWLARQTKEPGVVYRVGVILWEVSDASTDHEDAEILEEEYVGGDFESYEEALILWTALKDDRELVAAVRARIEEGRK